MKILIIYASTEGQTRKIARFAADRLHGQGHSVELVEAADALPVAPGRFDAAILAGSVHVGRLQDALLEAGRGAHDALRDARTLLIQVSLAAAGEDAAEWADLRRIAGDACDRMGWHPDRIAHVAGAFRFSEYDFFRRMAMRRIAAQKDPGVTPGEDHEYTDWDALGRLLDDWAASVPA